jgi:hypothetical protein
VSHAVPAGSREVTVALKCSETRKWREKLLSRKWPMVNEQIAYKKIINCANAVELRDIGNYLCTVRCKRENNL